MLQEVDHQLEHHELIKLTTNVNDRAALRDITRICTEATKSTLVDIIGKRFVLYRERVMKPGAKS